MTVSAEPRRNVEDIIFLEGEQADEAINVYRNEGPGAAMSFLSQWHYPGEHEITTEHPEGRFDATYEIGNYVLSVSTIFNTIGLTFAQEFEA